MDAKMIEPPAVRQFYRALLTLRALPDPDLKYFPINTAWPEFPRRAIDAYGYSAADDLENISRFIPAPADIDKYLEILKWGQELNIPQWRIMEYRAQEYSLTIIADFLRWPINFVVMEFQLAVAEVERASLMGVDNPTKHVQFSRHHNCA
jgi:hypothetical protein